MNPEFEKILDTCTEDMRAGKTLERVLAGYPNDAQQLKPLLEMAMQLEGLPAVEPSKVGLATTLIRIGRETTRGRGRFTPGRSWPLSSPTMAWAAAAALVLIVSFTGVSSLSASSAPGDFLYPVKLVTEKVRFLLTLSSENKAELRLTFSEERLTELVRHSQQSGSVDTSLLRIMLTQAELALENADMPSEQAVLFLSRLQHTNAYQQDMLERIKPRIDSASRIQVDRAIEICGMRGRWLTDILAQETSRDQTDSVKPQEASQSTKSNWDWGPGCSCD